ncbi:Monothiol glutaredoxin-S7, chloroplastic [Hordeum vulgare]|nr:Monothiol glutaredoxin-S7, chloroplastic [Hordeum vulgare]
MVTLPIAPPRRGASPAAAPPRAPPRPPPCLPAALHLRALRRHRGRDALPHHRQHREDPREVQGVRGACGGADAAHVLHLPAAVPVFAHYKAAYYTILASVLFIAVPVELATAFYLPCCSDGLRLLGFARGLLPCAYMLLLVVISVGGFVPFKLQSYLLQL